MSKNFEEKPWSQVFEWNITKTGYLEKEFLQGWDLYVVHLKLEIGT